LFVNGKVIYQARHGRQDPSRDSACHAIERDRAPWCAVSESAHHVSHTKAKVHNPIGKATKIGWSGCFLILAGLAIFFLLLSPARILKSAYATRLGVLR